MSDDPNVIGPTGKFPHGKLHAGDKGELKAAISHTPDGKIILAFGTELSWLAMTADDAEMFAALLIKHAKEVRAAS